MPSSTPLLLEPGAGHSPLFPFGAGGLSTGSGHPPFPFWGKEQAAPVPFSDKGTEQEKGGFGRIVFALSLFLSFRLSLLFFPVGFSLSRCLENEGQASAGLGHAISFFPVGAGA